MLTLLVFAGTAETRLQAQGSKVEDAREPAPFDADYRPAGPLVRFIVYGDWGTGNRSQQRVADGMGTCRARDGADAVLGTGDNFYPAGVTSTTDAQWRAKFEEMYPVSSLPVPFFQTLGNHDYGGDPDAEVRYTGSRTDHGTTRWHLPARYWSERFEAMGGHVSVRVVGLDTQILTGTDAAARNRELAWLDSTLAAATETWIIVTGHHPVYSNGRHGITIGMQRHVQPILEKRGVALYLAGHDHDLQVLESVRGVSYVVSGGGGGSRSVRWTENTRFAATNLGFVWLAAGEKEMVVHILDADGTVRWGYTIPIVHRNR